MYAYYPQMNAADIAALNARIDRLAASFTSLDRAAVTRVVCETAYLLVAERDARGGAVYVNQREHAGCYARPDGGVEALQR